MPGAPSLLTHLDRTFDGDAPANPPKEPAMLYTLTQLEEGLKVWECAGCATEGGCNWGGGAQGVQGKGPHLGRGKEWARGMILALHCLLCSCTT
eukprot:356142-Chlamydomonas_euryale.AAC.2